MRSWEASYTFAGAMSLALFAAQPAPAAIIYSEGWDTPGDAAGWIGNVLNSVVSVPAAGGNPGGYLDLTEGPTFDIVGAVGNFAPIIGDYGAAGINGVSFDLNLFSGTFTSTAFRVRYQDATFNGWFFPVSYAPAGGWQHFAINFDPTWTDLQAMAAGWISDGSSTVDFAMTMSNVFNPEIRLEGTGSDLHAGLDNFAVNAVARTVPEPSTLVMFFAGLLSLFGFIGLVRPRAEAI